MITENVYWSTLLLLAFALKKAWAAGPEIPIVHILATDSCAAESGLESATFTVFRTGPMNEALTVHYCVSGSASDGVDYAELSGPGTVPACASSAPIAVRAEGKNSHCYGVELSSNLTDWEPLEANIVTDDDVHFVYPEAVDFGARFYRVVPASDVEVFADE